MKEFIDKAREQIPVLEEYVRDIYRSFQFNKNRQSEFLHQFASLMAVGRMPYDIADHIVKFGQKTEQEIASNIKFQLQNGLLISDALAGWIDPMKLAALKAAEEGGQEGFVIALKIISTNLIQETDTAKTSKAKILMPFVYTLMSFALVIGINFKFLPIFKGISQGPLPKPIQDIERYSGFLVGWGWLLLLAAVIGIFLFKYLEKNLVGDHRDRLEVIKIGSWNPFGGFRMKVGAHIIESFALLKRFNFSAYSIYRILIREGSAYQKHHVQIMTNQLPEGNESEIDSLDSGLLEPQYISLLKLYTGAENMNIVDQLNSAARDIKRRCEKRIQVNTDIIYYILWMTTLYNLTAIVNVFMATSSSR